MIVYVSIGNSDDKLSQQRWADFCTDLDGELRERAQIHGEWYSLPDSPWQNACWCVEFTDPQQAEDAKAAISAVRAGYDQDSAAWAPVAETEFV